MVAVHIVVEDPNGERYVRVGLFNYGSSIPLGTILALMNPWFKLVGDGTALIRCENPIHVRVVDPKDEILKDVVWKVLLQLETRPTGKKDADPAKIGNEFFCKNDYASALAAYGDAIEKFPTNATLYANRALTYLRMEKPDLGLKDCEIGLSLDPTDLKLIYRKGKSLLFLERYKDSIEFMESIMRQNKTAITKEFMDLVEISKRMQGEHEKGEFDIFEMMKEVKEKKHEEFGRTHADYVAPVFELKQIDEKKGRGLVATSKIKAGTLLMACKAFAYAKAEEGIFASNLEQWTVESFSFMPVVQKICDKLINNPGLAADFYKLYANEELGHLEAFDLENPVDMDQISAIVQTNSFKAENDIDKASDHASDGGVWLLPSFINHSCIDTNCFRHVIGDHMFVRATRNIEMGEEFLFPYFAGEPDERERGQRRFGFQCVCRLCEAEQSCSTQVAHRLKEIKEFIDGLKMRQMGFFSKTDVLELSKLLEETEKYLDKSLNVTAVRVRMALRVAIRFDHPDRSNKMMEENIEIMKNQGDLHSALLMAKSLCSAKWAKKAKEWAKVLWGNERVADLVQWF